jgi:penicillin-binding protein 2
MSIDTIHKYAAEMGLVGKTGIDLPGEVDSLVPSTQWKLKTTGERWYPGETISVGIGQGPVSVTPISLATMIATVANGGTVVTPHVLRAIDGGQGWQPMPPPPPKSVFPLRPDVLGPVRDGLWLAVNGAGTATSAKIAGHDVVGKTGTAQVVSLQNKRNTLDHRDHSWFVFYAPREHPEVAGVIFVEHGGWGATAAVPIAKHVLETFFAKREGRPLPAWPLAGSKTTQAAPAAPAPARGTAEVPAAAAAASTATPAGRPAPVPATVAAVGTRSLE